MKIGKYNTLSDFIPQIMCLGAIIFIVSTAYVVLGKENHAHGDIENIREPKNTCEAYAIKLYWMGVDGGRETCLLEIHPCPKCGHEFYREEEYRNTKKNPVTPSTK